MANRLEVEVGAEIKELQKKLAAAEKSIKGFDAKAAKNVKSFGNTTKTVTKDLGKFNKGAANGASAMTAFSRTVQDAPFGLMGVSNNITNLTEQFGYLKKRTGSAGGALKAMLNDLKGFGGITLGISLATSAMLIFGDEIKDLISDNSAFAKSQKAVNEALNDFYGNSVSKINSYMSILDDVNTSEEQRKNITEELIKVVPSLKKEDFSYGNNLDIVRKKIGAYVLAQASRVEADALVQANSKKLSQLARINQIKEIKDEKKRITELTKFLKNADVDVMATRSTTSSMGMIGFETVQQNKKQITNTFNNFAKELETELKPIQEKINQLYGDTFSGGLGTSGAKPSKISKDTFVKEIKTDFKIDIPELIDFDSINSDLEFNTVNWESYLNLKQLDNQKELLMSKMQSIADGLQSIKDNSFVSAISGIGDAIGSSIANGGNVLQAIGSSLLRSFGQYLSQMGAQMILYGKLAVAKGKLDLAIAAGGPVAIAAGAASIGVGIAAVAAGAAIGALASGGFGGSTGNSNAGQGSSYNGGSTFTSGVSSQTNQGMTLVLRGEDMYGAMSAYVGRNKNLGTNLSFT